MPQKSSLEDLLKGFDSLFDVFGGLQKRIERAVEEADQKSTKTRHGLPPRPQAGLMTELRGEIIALRKALSQARGQLSLSHERNARLDTENLALKRQIEAMQKTPSTDHAWDTDRTREIESLKAHIADMERQQETDVRLIAQLTRDRLSAREREESLSNALGDSRLLEGECRLQPVSGQKFYLVGVIIDKDELIRARVTTITQDTQFTPTIVEWLKWAEVES